VGEVRVGGNETGQEDAVECVLSDSEPDHPPLAELAPAEPAGEVDGDEPFARVAVSVVGDELAPGQEWPVDPRSLAVIQARACGQFQPIPRLP